uniref:DNA repair protein RAD50 n=1 Tax=Actinia equina TaxID=6106 RepID=A0A6C0WWJ5_ACTEQ|nr:DNA repair protein RAD50 [Actinia equina]
MSSIEKLKIQGIRSYSQNEPAAIEFFKPLTLIVGSNGAGKTSIIECLKYVTTGDLPPGSKNSYFVHDPKVAGEQEIKGQVKLMFKDITGKTVVVTRALISQQKGKKLETRSLESVIKKDIHGERRSLSSKCAEVNHEMISMLGVSKAVLENVIFCHQEDSNWPLSEGKALKQKFDEIFAATRYIKALEAIRKLRLEQGRIVIQCETELKYLRENKDKAQEIAEQLEKSQGKIEATRDSIVKISRNLEPVEIRLTEIEQIAVEVSQLQKEKELLMAKKEQLADMEQDLLQNITDVFTGSAEELQGIYQDFQNKIKEKNELLKQKENEHQHLVAKQQELSNQKSSILQEQGKLEQQAQRHQTNLEDRDHMVLTLANYYEIQGYSKAPFTEAQVDRFIEDLKKNYANIVEETKQQKELFKNKIEVVQKKIDDIKRSQAEYGETIRLKRKLMGDNQRELKAIGQELSNVNASANRLKSLDAELQHAIKELEEANELGNVDEMNAEIEKLQNDKRQVDGELSRLREEQQTMHFHSTTKTKLDMLIKEKVEKEDNIQKLMNKHDEDIKTIIGGTGTTESLSDKLGQYLQNKGKELQDTRNRMQRIKQAQSAKEANKKNIEDQLKRKVDQAATYKQQLKDACGENDYNTMKEQLSGQISFLRNEKGLFSSIEKIYKKYIKKLQEEAVKEEGCPLCHRCFDSSKQIKSLIAELNEKVVHLPAKREENNILLDQEEKRYEKILKLGPIKENLEKLETSEIQEVKSRLADISKDLEKMEAQIIELEDVYSLTESEEMTARQMEPDLREVENYKRSLKDLDKNISLYQSQLQGIAPGRTMQAVTNEITDRQDRSETLDRHIDRRRRALTQLQRQLSTLRSNVHDLKSKKLKLNEQLQRRTHLEEQKAELTSKNDAFAREIKDAESQSQPIQAMLDEEESKKHSIVANKEAMEEDKRKLLTDMKTNGERLREKISEIKRYTSQGGESALQDNQERLKAVEDREKQIHRKKLGITEIIDSFKEDISKQEIKSRDIEDNLKLKNTQKDIQNMENKIQSVEGKLDQYGDPRSLNSERSRLHRQLDDLHKEKSHLEGRQKGFEDEIRRYQTELRSNMYNNAEEKHRQKVIEMKTTQMASVDLDKYYKALDRAIMKYHSLKMAEINKIIKEYWINTYKGGDIDTIEIRSDEEEGSGASKARRTYNYRVVMIKRDIVLDMRGRCSAGQKVLASLIIRLALAETFCLNCGIFTLDEPTTNLDESNVYSLADQLANVIRTRQAQRNFQLVVITHDEEFVDTLGRADFVDYYYKIYKNESGFSKIAKQSVASLQREASYVE